MPKLGDKNLGDKIGDKVEDNSKSSRDGSKSSRDGMGANLAGMGTKRTKGCRSGGATIEEPGSTYNF